MFTSLQCIWTLLRICYQMRSQVTCTFSGELNSKVHSQVPVIPVKASWLLVSRGYHGWLITSCSRATPAFRFAPPTPTATRLLITQHFLALTCTGNALHCQSFLSAGIPVTVLLTRIIPMFTHSVESSLCWWTVSCSACGQRLRNF